MKNIFTLLILGLFCQAAFSQNAQSPEGFLNHAQQKCSADIEKLCKKSATPAEKIECLAKQQTKLSGPCLDTLSATMPCMFDLYKHCDPKKPAAEQAKCLVEKQGALSEKCLQFMDNNLPCELEAKKSCADKKTQQELLDCLMDNVKSARYNCSKTLTARFPCYFDQKNHCSSVTNSDEMYDCLKENYDKISSNCKAVRLPCATDEDKFCKGLTGGAKTLCIKENEAKLSDTCKKAVETEKMNTLYLLGNSCQEAINKHCSKAIDDLNGLYKCLKNVKEELPLTCKMMALYVPDCEKDIIKNCSDVKKEERDTCIQDKRKLFSKTCRQTMNFIEKDPDYGKPAGELSEGEKAQEKQAEAPAVSKAENK